MPLELANVPQILDILVNDGILTKPEKFSVLDDIKAGKTKKFAGEAALEKFPEKLTKEILGEKLLAQVVLKAEAATKDLAIIAKSGKQDLPQWPLAPSWGNNGVVPASANPTISDSVSASANIAANMALLVNGKPELAKNEKIAAGIQASSDLALYAAGKKKFAWTEIQALVDKSRDGLRETVKESGVAPLDKTGKPIDLEQFISARFSEVTSGVNQRSNINYALSSLDIGAEGRDRSGAYIATSRDGKPLRDGIVGAQELAAISDTAANGHRWDAATQAKNAAARGALKDAIDTDRDGKASLKEVTSAIEASGMKIDAKALQATLETGRMPSPETPAGAPQAPAGAFRRR